MRRYSEDPRSQTPVILLLLLLLCRCVGDLFRNSNVSGARLGPPSTFPRKFLKPSGPVHLRPYCVLKMLPSRESEKNCSQTFTSRLSTVSVRLMRVHSLGANQAVFCALSK
ncbi:hypothetical protein FB451DRAFT_693477 [Mycena latifolia]|nr:hypothetical protein FB451DRAFT_693477 [Mycena latifolia]